MALAARTVRSAAAVGGKKLLSRKGRNENVHTTETTSPKTRSGCYNRPHSSGRAASPRKIGRLRAPPQRRRLAHLHRAAWIHCDRACGRAAPGAVNGFVPLEHGRELLGAGRPVVLLPRELRCWPNWLRLRWQDQRQRGDREASFLTLRRAPYSPRHADCESASAAMLV